jgi:ABC-type polar amino acid transport system ATPase subunit
MAGDAGVSDAVDPMMRIDRLRLQRGERTILRGVTLDVARGDMIAVMGPSGSGKTTILRAVAGLERFQEGRIDVDGVALVGGSTAPAATLRDLRRKVGMVFQFHYLFEHLSAIANVCLAPVHAYGVAPADAKRRGLELLAAFGVEHRADALPRELSGGEAQRVAIARALAVDPPVLLMDEPTASLDPDRRGRRGEAPHAVSRALIARGPVVVHRYGVRLDAAQLRIRPGDEHRARHLILAA